MSALWADDDDTGGRARPGPRTGRGRNVGNRRSASASSVQAPASQPRRLSRVPFVLVLIVIFGVGMAGLLALNTTLQDQSFQERSLHNRADKLEHREATLDRKSQDLRAPDRLAGKAWELGLRPNDRPTVITLSNGKVIGKPGAANKHAMPGINHKSAKEAKKKRTKEKTKHTKKTDSDGADSTSHQPHGGRHDARDKNHEEPR